MLDNFTPKLQINGQTIPGDTRFSEDQVPGNFGRAGEACATQTLVLPGHTVGNAIEQVLDVNRRLLDKIYILQMKVDVDLRQYENSKKEIQEKGKEQVQARETELKHLKSYVEQKEANIEMLSKENKKKNAEIQRLQQYVSELRKDVEASKKFADDIQYQLDMISGDSDIKRKEACTEKENEMAQLRTEVNNMKEHLATLENELMKAKDTIVEQQLMMRLMENDRKNIHRKFQVDLEQVHQVFGTEIEKLREIGRKQLEAIRAIRAQNREIQNSVVQQVVRTEIETLRDAMSKQWEAIREIRTQNMEIQNFVAEIRQILPAQNIQTRPTERDINAVSTIPVLPAMKYGKQNGNQGGRKS